MEGFGLGDLVVGLGRERVAAESGDVDAAEEARRGMRGRRRQDRRRYRQ